MKKATAVKGAIVSQWKDRSPVRSWGESAFRTARRWIGRLSEEEKVAILGLVATLILRFIATADPRVKLVLVALLAVMTEVLGSYLDSDPGRVLDPPH